MTGVQTCALPISHGANLLIVNNKGQTPCSLAVNKLKQSTCNFLFQMEEMQIKDGGAFIIIDPQTLMENVMEISTQDS